MKLSGRKRAWLAAGAIALCGTAVWAAEQVTVQGARAYVLKGKGSLYLPPLATAPHGAVLDVVGHEGRWLKVQYNGVEGYVLESAAKGESSGSSGASGGPGGNTEATAAAASRGFGEQEKGWASKNNYSREGLNAMHVIHNRVAANPAAFEKFKADGHVGAQ